MQWRSGVSWILFGFLFLLILTVSVDGKKKSRKFDGDFEFADEVRQNAFITNYLFLAFLNVSGDIRVESVDWLVVVKMVLKIWIHCGCQTLLISGNEVSHGCILIFWIRAWIWHLWLTGPTLIACQSVRVSFIWLKLRGKFIKFGECNNMLGPDWLNTTIAENDRGSFTRKKLWCRNYWDYYCKVIVMYWHLATCFVCWVSPRYVYEYWFCGVKSNSNRNGNILVIREFKVLLGMFG